MMITLFWAFCFAFVVAARADDQPAPVVQPPVSIKVIQVADPKADIVEVQVINSSKDTIIVDRNALQAPDYTLSKELPSDGSGSVHGLNTGKTHGSVGGHWSLAQLQRRESDRVITIPPGQTFTMELDVGTMLKGVDEEFQHGDIEVKFGFRDLILAVGSTEADVLMFGTVIQAEEVMVHRH